MSILEQVKELHTNRKLVITQSNPTPRCPVIVTVKPGTRKQLYRHLASLVNAAEHAGFVYLAIRQLENNSLQFTASTEEQD